jgi:Penicillinase repressor
LAKLAVEIPDPPGYSAVRATLSVLEEKKHIRHEEKDLHYVYLPVVPRGESTAFSCGASSHTFFDGSTEQGAPR